MEHEQGEHDLFVWSMAKIKWAAFLMVVVCTPIGVIFLEPSWPLWKRTLGGVILGVTCAVFLLTNRFLSASDGDTDEADQRG